MEKVVSAMMNSIASEVCGREINKSEYQLSDNEFEQLFAYSKFHDLAHLVGEALTKNGLVKNEVLNAEFQKQIVLAAFRYDGSNQTLERLREALNQTNIPFIPLKGAVLRHYYPEPWMRTSCDIDILVHKTDAAKALEILIKKFDGKQTARTHHDVSFQTSDGISIEVHHDLIEKGRIGIAEKLLENIWDYADRVGQTFEYTLRDEMFYYYHLSHMAKHIEGGGCGVRPFLDLFLLDTAEHDEEKRAALLKAGGLDQFSKTAGALSQYWFNNGTPNALVLELEQYILTSGVYGNLENRSAVKRVQKKGRKNYIFARLWLPYQDLVLQYPSLKGRKFLLLFYEIKRWCRLLNPSMFRRKKKELNLIANLSDNRIQSTDKMLKDLGLI